MRSVRDAIKRLRIGYVSEDRKYDGMILDHAIRSNIAITVWDSIACRLRLLTRNYKIAFARPLAVRLEIRAPSLGQRVGNLSGGNQQKVSLAKWLAADVDILIIDEPTVGTTSRPSPTFTSSSTSSQTEGWQSCSS
jgi:ribose transport system ATP-binding protein